MERGNSFPEERRKARSRGGRECATSVTEEDGLSKYPRLVGIVIIARTKGRMGSLAVRREERKSDPMHWADITAPGSASPSDDVHCDAVRRSASANMSRVNIRRTHGRALSTCTHVSVHAINDAVSVADREIVRCTAARRTV